MRNIGIVIKHEILTTLSRRSFWIMTFLFPLLIVGFQVGMQIMAQDTFGGEVEIIGSEEKPGSSVGYVDEAGAMSRLPASLPPGLVQSFADTASAQAALEAGTIERYYVIAADWLQTGDILAVEREFKLLSTTSGEGIIEYLLNYGLVGDEGRASLVMDPTPLVENHPLAPQGARDSSNPLSFVVPLATVFIFFFLLTMSGGYMQQSVSKEKENRTAEVLLLSLRPRELMLGKVLGLGVIALFQMAVWMGGSLLALDWGRQALKAAQSFALPPGFVAWAVAYFILGYLTYASVLGAIGALAPSMREGSQFTFVAMLPLMIPLWVNTVFAQAPNGGLATFLSLFPLTAPTAMITRLSAGVVPAWQAAVGLAGLAVTTYILVLLSARFFKAETLLSGAGLNWARIVKELKRS